MNYEESKAIAGMREEILDMKKELFNLNNLVSDMIKELKINICMKTQSENSKEMDDILKNCLDNF